MLQVKAFKISDDIGLNDLLTKYPLAAGAHVFVSDGQLMVPYENGQPEPAALKAARIGENKNTMLREREIIEHSQEVLELLLADAQNRVNVAQAEVDKAFESKDKKTYNADKKAELQKKLTDAKQAQGEVANQHRMNEHEIVRLNVNVEKFDTQIAKLSA